jgi:hypothetical protein
MNNRIYTLKQLESVEYLNFTKNNQNIYHMGSIT